MPDPTSSLRPSALGLRQQLQQRRILVIGPSNIGDAVLASPVVETLHRRYPQAHLTVVVGARAKAVFTDDPRVQTLVDADLYDSAAGRLKLALALWRHHPHIVVDLRHTLYPLLLKPLQSWRYLRQPPPALRHMRDRHLWKLHAQAPATRPTSRQKAAALRRAVPLRFTPKDAAHVDGLWRRWQLNGERRVVLICPGARSHIKRWVLEGFAQVANRLIAEEGVEVVFSGEPDEKPVIEEILALMTRRAHTSVGLTTVRQLGLLMQRVALVITNDSASLHLASAVQAPTLAIFGPTDAGKYGPTSPRSRTLSRRLFCAPCERSLCRFSHECMRFISADEVYEAARGLLHA